MLQKRKEVCFIICFNTTETGGFLQCWTHLHLLVWHLLLAPQLHLNMPWPPVMESALAAVLALNFGSDFTPSRGRWSNLHTSYMLGEKMPRSSPCSVRTLICWASASATSETLQEYWAGQFWRGQPGAHKPKHWPQQKLWDPSFCFFSPWASICSACLLIARVPSTGIAFKSSNLLT